MFRNDPEIADVLSGKSKRLAPLIKLVFKNGGLLNMVFNKKFKGRTDIVYGERPNQTAISYTADKSLYLSEVNGKPHHALIEAGTGTGKSFAELVPFSLKVAIENQGATSPEEKKRVLIVTHTTTLQSQLYNEDIPDVQEVLSMVGLSFKATLLKGK